ncbi:HD-GYP domain-containing protein [Paenibacillus allorhizosphaerae]|uniref:HD-GYP domain-containing protein n=1 Tax=Paenibacillus allorhizosphaerae TaxID=2849866 RepID=A0ABM8VJJ2_9BACL|nr:HD-GYP domain-containing protein [Paenibacillus allorhizosphaerae]CAG7645253.1 hypothetical protein PAECIP111802_03469 [Paenibacillus allorhizosphaerae]
MKRLNSILRHAIGKKLNRDIFSDSGVLLIPNAAIINYEHTAILKKHGIMLKSQDVAAIGPYINMKPYPHDQSIEEAVWLVRQMFEEVRRTKKIPLGEIRNDVIPMILEAAAGNDIFGLFAALQAKDDYTYRHNVAVGAIAALLGTWLGLDHQELLQLSTAALLHDVGKMLIPQDILQKPDKLTAEEYAWMKNHTVLGYELLKDTVGIIHRQTLVALQHHERMDGSGYPLGNTGSQMDPFSRIVAVADVFHAMSSKRAYRGPLPFYEVLLQMEKEAFGALDPAITKRFIDKIMSFSIGNSVMLTDGREGTILMIQPHDPTHPLVQAGEAFIDLSKESSLQISQIF